MRYGLRHGAAKGAQLNVVAFEDAGPWVMVAGAIAAMEDSGGSALRFAIDADRFNTASEKDYLEKLYIPGILRAGGLKNAAALLAPRDLLLHNTVGAFDTSWAEAAYRLSPDASLTLNRETQADHSLIEFLTQAGRKR